MSLKIDTIGFWSEIKLDILRQYAQAYSKILSTKGVYPVYIDAFTGSGKYGKLKLVYFKQWKGLRPILRALHLMQRPGNLI